MRPSRRDVLRLLAAGAAPLAAGPSFRLAICNETFRPSSFRDGCRIARRAGYGGLEIAPYTLSDDPASLSPSRLAELREILAAEDCQFVGLHNLLTAPAGLHVTTPDTTVRNRSWAYLRRLIDLCADLGTGGVLVFGSGKQRATTGGSTAPDAVQRLEEGLASLGPAAERRGVTILLEALAPHLSDVVTSLDEAVAVVRRIGSPAVQTMFDTHNAVAEKRPHSELVRKHCPHIRHVHVSEMDGRRPGTGRYDFKPVLRALRACSYKGWISVEVFDFAEGGENIAARSAQFLRAEEARL